ncbi:hypothetical protein FS837_007779 [Tulasnella sp. UAMH 9824]|nr:hypothetical protein FS837_007779 [Tulasnella sp. UAMH 9824]
MLVEIDGEFRFGGVDDVYEQMEQGGEDADEEEDLFEIHPSRLTKRHRFFGTIEVKSRNVLSEKGSSLLENAGADLNALDEGGVIYVVIRGIFHRYETSSFTQDNGTWVTSSSYYMKLIKGTMTIQQYMEMFPHHESGVHPISDGPPKNTQAPEVRLALARNADFIHKKLKTANPRPMNINEWTKLKLTYKKSLMSLEPVYGGASESEEEGASGNEGDEDEVMDIGPGVRTPSRRIASSVRGRSRDFSRDTSLFGPPHDEDIEELGVALDAVELPRDTTKKLTIRHRPSLSASFQYHCPFNSPVAEQSEASSHQCTFKVDLLRLTQQQIGSLPQDLRGLVETSKTKLSNPSLSVLLAVLLDPHIIQHLRRQSGINQAFGLYEVEVPIHPAAAHLVAQSAGIHRRFDRQSNLVRYRWVVEPGSGDDEDPRAR